MLPERPVIIDAFPFFNELDILELRLTLMDDVVDKFILVEGTKTFSGIDKPLYFEQNCQRYARFAHKIVHVVVDDYPETNDPWERASIQKDAIRRGVNKEDGNAFLLISDVDEFVDPDILVESVGLLSDDVEAVRYLLRLFYFYGNYQNVLGEQSDWPGPFLVRVSSLDNKAQSLSVVRMSMMTRHWEILSPMPSSLPSVPLAGWHFSYLGDDKRLHYKLRSIADHLPEEEISTLSIPSLIQERRGPYDDRYPLNVWAFVDPETLRLPDIILSNPIFQKFIINEVDSMECIFQRCKDAAFRCRYAHAAKVGSLRKKIDYARSRRLYKRIMRLLHH